MGTKSMPRRRWLPTLLMLMLGLMAAASACEEGSGQTVGGTQQALSSDTQVRGFITVDLQSKDGQKEGNVAGNGDLYLPDVRVFLRNASTNEDTDISLTDLSGRFTVRAKGGGRFRVCWDAENFQKGCSSALYSISGRFRHIGNIAIPLPKKEGYVALYGRVTLANGQSARALDPLANVNAFARVALLDGSGKPMQEVATSNHDTYLLPLVPAGKRMGLRVEDEGYRNDQALELDGAQSVQKLDLLMRNFAPKIDPLVALDSMKRRVSNATGRTTVQLSVRVSDRDKDDLKFFWRVSSGTLSSNTDLEPKWSLPSVPGNHAATLVAYDGRGGYASASLNITVNRAGLTFSGRVSGTDTPMIAGAEVEVNGKLAVTDSSGFFTVNVPDRKRFVLTIRKKGYAFASHIFYDAAVGGNYRLTRAQVFSVDPTQPIDLSNVRTPRECQGAPSNALDFRTYPALAVPQYQDGQGNVIAAPKDQKQQLSLPADAISKVTQLSAQTALAINPGLIVKQPGAVAGQDRSDKFCGPGVRVIIPANGIVDSLGHAPTGLVDIQLSTVDLSTGDQMPGDYTVDPAGGSGKMAQSYGAGIIEMSAGSTKYNLKPGVQATLVMPVDRVQLNAAGALPPTIPLLRYDEPRGVWVEDGTLSLQTVNGTPAYVTKVSHFTAYNSDLIKTGQSCLAIQNQGMPANYSLEVTVPFGGGAAPAKVVKSVVGGDQETVLLNLPANTNITLVPIRTTDPDPAKNNMPMGIFVVNTGAPQNPAAPTVPGGFINEPMGPPYYHETAGVSDGPCSTKVVLHDLGLNFYPGAPPAGAFLHGIGSFAAVNLSDTDPAFPTDTDSILRDAVTQASQDYRAQIDPRHIRQTLNCFKVVNRLPLDPPLTAADACPEHAGTGFVPQAALAETKVAYANSADLGFGLAAHCVQDGAKVACYMNGHDALVYTGPSSSADVTKAQHAVEGLQGVRAPDVTLAMEYSQIEDEGDDGTPVSSSDPDMVVKFYVFNQSGAPLNSANVDQLGERPVPQLCLSCHGGLIPNATAPSTGSGVPTPAFGSRDEVKLDAKFLPFDLRNFTFAAPDSDAANPYNKANQQVAFRTLNQLVKVAPPVDPFDPLSDGVSVLYDTWYPGGAVPQQETAPVSYWNGDALHRTMYTELIGRSCRSCHIANSDPNLRFERPGTSLGVGFDGHLGTLQQRVCKDHVMPHSRRTHDLFWTSTGPNQPALLQAYGDTINAFAWQHVGDPGVDPTLLCGDEYTSGGVAPVSPPATATWTDVQAILSTNCTGCHNAGHANSVAYAKLNLDSGAAYAQLVGHDAFEYSAMKRVQAGDPDNSYLWRKISNTHTGLGGSYTSPGPGSPMPQGSAMGLLVDDPAAANTIRDWIMAGAPP